MFRKNALLQNAFPLFAALCLVAGVLSFVGCDDDPGFVDNHQLNGWLIGTWSSGYDGYTINATSIVYNAGGIGGDFTGTIRYIYNFSETAGVIIVEYTVYPSYTDYYGNLVASKVGKFQGVYFRNSTASTVRLGSAYTVADYTVPVEVDTLAAAIWKFMPANISLYGGELSVASTQTRQ